MVYTISWLLAAVLAYLFFGFASLADKLVLNGTTEGVSRPKAYTFYVGVFGLISIVLIPFVKFVFPGQAGLTWLLLDALVRVFGLYTMYVAVSKFDISKVIATIGATQPIFIFIMTWIFWGAQTMRATDILAFILLFLGSVIISFEKSIKLTANYLQITIFSSLMFSLDYIFAKLVYSNMPFFSGIIWIQLFTALLVMIFLISKKSRKEIFSKQVAIDKKKQWIFLFAQIIGGAGNFLQGVAISLAPVVFLATINSLRGIQYAFLFMVTLLTSYFYPKFLKEELSRKIVFQKTFSIILIIAGLMFLIA